MESECGVYEGADQNPLGDPQRKRDKSIGSSAGACAGSRTAGPKKTHGKSGIHIGGEDR